MIGHGARLFPSLEDVRGNSEVCDDLIGLARRLERRVRTTPNISVPMGVPQLERLRNGVFVIAAIRDAVDPCEPLLSMTTTDISMVVQAPHETGLAYYVGAQADGAGYDPQSWMLCCKDGTRAGLPQPASLADIPEARLVEAACVEWGRAIVDLFLARKRRWDDNAGDPNDAAFYSIRGRAHALACDHICAALDGRDRATDEQLHERAGEVLVEWCAAPAEENVIAMLVNYEVASDQKVLTFRIRDERGDPSEDAIVALTHTLLTWVLALRYLDAAEFPDLPCVDGRGEERTVEADHLAAMLMDYLDANRQFEDANAVTQLDMLSDDYRGRIVDLTPES